MPFVCISSQIIVNAFVFVLMMTSTLGYESLVLIFIIEQCYRVCIDVMQIVRHDASAMAVLKNSDYLSHVDKQSKHSDHILTSV